MMNKTARIKICNILSPNRFEKTAAPLKQMLSNTWKTVSGLGSKFNRYLDSVPDYKFLGSKDDGFLKSLWHSTTGYLNPKNYKDTIMHGIPYYMKHVRDTTLNPSQWKAHPFLNTWETAWNIGGPTLAYKFLTDDSPQNDTEGMVEKTFRNVSNVADFMDPTGGIMNRGVTGAISGLMGGITGRFGGIPYIASKIDNMLGTSASKEQLISRLKKRVSKEVPQLLKQYPDADPIQVQAYAIQKTLQEYGPEATEKIFS